MHNSIQFWFSKRLINYNIYMYIVASEESFLLSHMGPPKNAIKRNKILNIGFRTILYKKFSYSFSILN